MLCARKQDDDFEFILYHGLTVDHETVFKNFQNVKPFSPVFLIVKAWAVIAAIPK